MSTWSVERGDGPSRDVGSGDGNGVRERGIRRNTPSPDGCHARAGSAARSRARARRAAACCEWMVGSRKLRGFSRVAATIGPAMARRYAWPGDGARAVEAEKLDGAIEQHGAARKIDLDHRGREDAWHAERRAEREHQGREARRTRARLVDVFGGPGLRSVACRI